MIAFRRVLLSLVLLFVMLAVTHTARAQRAVNLFFIERNKNANIVVYDASLTNDGIIDARDPVHAYWIMKAENGRREGLTGLERTHAYGVTARVDPDRRAMWLTLVAYKERPIRVTIDANGAVRAETQIANRRSYLNKIYVKASNGLIPSVEYIELFGTDAQTGAPLRERRSP